MLSRQEAITMFTMLKNLHWHIKGAQGFLREEHRTSKISD